MNELSALHSPIDRFGRLEPQRVAILLAAVGCSLMLSGCQAGSSTSAGLGSSSSSMPEPKVVAAETLPIGDQMPPLDEGRLLLSKPKDWFPAPRSRSYVVQFYRDKTRQVRFPRVWVHAINSPFDGMVTVEEDQVTEFAELMAERLKEKQVEVIEPVRPMIIGGIPCTRYVRATSFTGRDGKALLAERQVIDILAGGRLYTVELHVPPRKMLDYRDYGYAVVASMKFPKAAEAEKAAEKEGADPSEGETDSPSTD